MNSKSIGTPEEIVAHESGIYWETTAAEFDPDNDKVMLKTNGRIFSVRFDGGPPVEVAHRDQHAHPLFADSRGVARPRR